MFTAARFCDIERKRERQGKEKKGKMGKKVISLFQGIIELPRKNYLGMPVSLRTRFPPLNVYFSTFLFFVVVLSFDYCCCCSLPQ